MVVNKTVHIDTPYTTMSFKEGGFNTPAVYKCSKTAKQRFSELQLFVYKLNIDITVIARYIQRFFSAVFIVRQITFAFFDF